MSRYERVTFKPEGGRRRTIYLHRPQVMEMAGGQVLTGIEVNVEGDELAPRGVDERRHIISLDLVSRRVPMHMDNDYGLLEES